ncbi:Clp protease N-terminal domain-containing protein [Nonomuraea sp. SYSU D8015]|uniref:Clp protease N-terminal domain-containing protein n=1 Tax=Nonomuraea sp. SYSU D8015 TaxID=2593644 RepID=UPI001660BBD3|nr:Clp protease N-terminal domain-containing protein [Nonomuraea sp. SYSU D8015]
MFGSQKTPFHVAVKAAFEEARQRGDRRLGTEHLLLGLLHHPDTARALGVDLEGARTALDDLDKAALRMLGLEVGDLPKNPRKHKPVPSTALTSSARAVINQAIKATTAKTRSRDAHRQLALTLLAQRPPDPVAQLVDQLRIDRAAVLSAWGGPATA